MEGVTTLRHPGTNKSSTKTMNLPRPRLLVAALSPATSQATENVLPPSAGLGPSLMRGSSIEELSIEENNSLQGASLLELQRSPDSDKNVFINQQIRTSMIYDPITIRRQKGR